MELQSLLMYRFLQSITRLLSPREAKKEPKKQAFIPGGYLHTPCLQPWRTSALKKVAGTAATPVGCCATNAARITELPVVAGNSSSTVARPEWSIFALRSVAQE